MSKIIRYELEVEGAKGFLAPLSFPIAEAALGYIFAPKPRYLTAGAIIINSLWVKGSKSLQENGEHFDAACLQAYGVVNGLDYHFEDNKITIPHFKTDKEGNRSPKTFECTLKENIDRNVLEDFYSLIMPNIGNPKPLTAGMGILFSNWESGDPEIKENDELLVVACLACYFILKQKTSKLKKV